MRTEPAADAGSEVPHAPVATGPAFEDFYRAEHPGLFGALYLITGNRQEAEELMQEAFLKVWERWDRVEAMENPGGYVYRTAMNAFRMRRRRLAVATRRTLRLLPPSDAFDAIESQDSVDRALGGLPPRQRAALVLTDLLGYSSEEAGSMLGIRPVTVRVMASKARSVLRHVLGANDE